MSGEVLVRLRLAGQLGFGEIVVAIARRVTAGAVGHAERQATALAARYLGGAALEPIARPTIATTDRRSSGRGGGAWITLQDATSTSVIQPLLFSALAGC